MKTTLREFGELWPAEAKLLAGLPTGRTTVIANALPGADAPKEHRIRASFLRFLCVGGCEATPPAPKGVRVENAFIEGDDPDGEFTPGLDLESAKLCGDLALVSCYIPDLILLRYASGASLFFNRSEILAGIKADGLVLSGSCHVRGVDLKGPVRLVGAKIGGDLDCIGGRFETTVEGARALFVDKAKIKGALFLRGGTKIVGQADFSETEIGSLCDDPDCWPKGKGDIILDRCRYGALTGVGINATARLELLERQDHLGANQDFWPQPYEHLAKVFREMGHRDDAKKVLYAKEQRQRQDQRRVLRQDGQAGRAAANWAWSEALRRVVGYGLYPFRSLNWLLGIWVLGVVVFQIAAQTHGIKPNNAVVLRSMEWAACADDYLPPEGGAPLRWRSWHHSQLECFLDQPEADAYPKFNPWVYSADTLLPIVDLEMQTYWIPDERTGPGNWARWFLWVQIIGGWALSLLAVAGFSGLIKSE